MKHTTTFKHLRDWYLRRLAEVEKEEVTIRGSTNLSNHRALQRGLSDGLRLLREVVESGFRWTDKLPEEMILPKDFKPCP